MAAWREGRDAAGRPSHPPHFRPGAPLPPAARLARALDIPLRLLAVTPTVETMPGDSAVVGRLLPSGAAAALDLEAAAAADYLAALARRIGGRSGAPPVVSEVARGDPAQIMLARAQSRPIVLALATHGRTGLDALWSGSIGSRVIARGGGPFLLVHPEGGAAEALETTEA